MAATFAGNGYEPGRVFVIILSAKRVGGTGVHSVGQPNDRPGNMPFVWSDGAYLRWCQICCMKTSSLWPTLKNVRIVSVLSYNIEGGLYHLLRMVKPGSYGDAQEKLQLFRFSSLTFTLPPLSPNRIGG